MKVVAPEPGFVIRYSYLWYAEFAAGREEGTKNRPCAVVLVQTSKLGVQWVTVLPVTHAPPKDRAAAIEIPAEVKRRLRLDDERSWIVLNEANRFKWPGPDIRPLRGKGTQSAIYGPLPPVFFHTVLDRFVAALTDKKASTVTRSE